MYNAWTLYVLFIHTDSIICTFICSRLHETRDNMQQHQTSACKFLSTTISPS